MPLTITVEDGSGVDAANSYISRADATAYFESRLRTAPWTDATDADKDAALAMATRTIDSGYSWKGSKTNYDQSLQWPRTGYGVAAGPISGYYLYRDGYDYDNYVASNAIPKRLRDATCEQALALLTADRTGDPDNTGLSSVGVGKGAVSVTFERATARKAICPEARALLSPYISGGPGSAMKPVVRA